MLPRRALLAPVIVDARRVTQVWAHFPNHHVARFRRGIDRLAANLPPTMVATRKLFNYRHRLARAMPLASTAARMIDARIMGWVSLHNAVHTCAQKRLRRPSLQEQERSSHLSKRAAQILKEQQSRVYLEFASAIPSCAFSCFSPALIGGRVGGEGGINKRLDVAARELAGQESLRFANVVGKFAHGEYCGCSAMLVN